MEVDRLLSEAFVASHPTEAARAAETHPPAVIAAFLSDSARDPLIPALAAMDPAVAAAALAEVEAAVAAGFFEALPAHSARTLMRRLAPEARTRVLERLAPRAAVRVRTLLRHAPGSAGALLDPAVPTASPDRTVGETLRRVRDGDGDAHDGYLFVVARDGALRGAVGPRELLTAGPEALVGALARRAVAAVPATADRDTILAHPARNAPHGLPVVDAEGRFLGVVRPETVRRLKSAARATPLGTAAVDAAIDLGELAWAGGAALVGELLAALGSRSPTAPRETGG